MYMIQNNGVRQRTEPVNAHYILAFPHTNQMGFIDMGLMDFNQFARRISVERIRKQVHDI